MKFFVESLHPVKRRLKQLGAKFEWAGREFDRFFDTPEGRLHKKGAILRLRVTPDFSYLTYKEKIVSRNFKAAREYQVDGIKMPEELRKIFERLGFQVRFSYKKSRREFWKFEGRMITLDSFPFGKFVEIEGSEKSIRAVAKKLNLDFAKSSKKSYTQLLREQRKKK